MQAVLWGLLNSHDNGAGKTKTDRQTTEKDQVHHVEAQPDTIIPTTGNQLIMLVQCRLGDLPGRYAGK